MKSQSKNAPQRLRKGEPVVILNFVVVLRDGETHVEKHVSLRWAEAIGKTKDPMGKEVQHEAFELAARRYREEKELPGSHAVLSESVRFERGRCDRAK